MVGSATVTGWNRRSRAASLFNVFPVLGERGSADDLDLPPGKGRFQDVGGIHGAFGVSGTHQIVDLVNDQDDVAASL